MLYTLVEPHRGHEVEYNRWYERDHFYAGCQIGAYNFAGARFVATAPLKALPLPGAARPRPWSPTPRSAATSASTTCSTATTTSGTGGRSTRSTCSTPPAGCSSERDHIHTGLYHFEWEHRRDEDGVPAELTLDHRFPGMVSVFIEPAEGATPEQVGALVPRRVPALGAARVGGGHRAGLQPPAPAGRRPRRRAPRESVDRAAAAAVVPRRGPRRLVGRGLRPPGRGRGRRRAWAGCCGPRRSSAPSRAPTPTPTSCGRTPA